MFRNCHVQLKLIAMLQHKIAMVQQRELPCMSRNLACYNRMLCHATQKKLTYVLSVAIQKGVWERTLSRSLGKVDRSERWAHRDCHVSPL